MASQGDSSWLVSLPWGNSGGSRGGLFRFPAMWCAQSVRAGYILTPLPSSCICCPRGLPTDRYMWSDVTGLQECTKAGTKPPSLQWTWVSPASLRVCRVLPLGFLLVCGTEGRGSPIHTESLFPRSLTGMWTSVSLEARTRKDGSMPVISLREHLSTP